MHSNYNDYDTIYWVFTQLCNDQCGHCYNNSGPHGQRISEEDCMKVISNLPTKLRRLIISGGEPLAEKNKLYNILEAIKEKYKGATKVIIQTNGDLMTEKILDKLLKKGVRGFSIASLDRFHKHAGTKLEGLKKLFDSRGLIDAMPFITMGEKNEALNELANTYTYFGANEEMWLGGNWARGRAYANDIWMKDPNHNFCKIQSGARNFLGGHDDAIMEVSIQLWAVNPCCPGTKYPMGDARNEKVADILERMKKSEIFRKLNNGEVYSMGESVGVLESYARERGKDLQNICLWCDEFFESQKEVLSM